jgi:hypothetical protein
MKNKTYFFGWTNIKWFLREFMNIYSNSKSFFSKKRIESSIAFLIGQFGMILFIIINVSKMDSYDIVLWSGVEFAIAGYIVSQIQKEKKTIDDSENQTP